MNSLNLFFFFLLLGFLPYGLYAQCPSGDVNFSNQQDITDFIIAYPTCGVINGNLTIDDSANNGGIITDLSSLSNIHQVNGSLQIKNCPALPNLSGLDALDSIVGDLYIFENDHVNFKTMAGLGSLVYIKKRITVRHNDNLESFTGMGTIVGALVNEIKITDNPKLSSIASLSGITSVGDDVTIKRNKLTNLQGLNSLGTIGGFLNVREEPMLTDISQLSSLTSVGGVLLVWENPLLSNLDGLDNVTSISGVLSIYDNNTLSDCDAVCEIVNNNYATGINFGSNVSSSPCKNNGSIESHCLALLPIELVEFSSIPLDAKVRLEWITSAELNNAGFTIEKSTNGHHWRSIGWVDGNGTTSKTINYHFMDTSPSAGINYYRLQQTDLDGKITNSHVISEYFSRALDPSSISIYPNPVKDVLFLQHSYTEKVGVVIYNPFGKIVKRATDTAQGVEIKSIPNGVYFIQFSTESKTLDNQKLVILH